MSAMIQVRTVAVRTKTDSREFFYKGKLSVLSDYK